MLPWQLFALSDCMFHDNRMHDELTEQIIACAIAVHNTLGPGLLESIYQGAWLWNCVRERLASSTAAMCPGDLSRIVHRVASLSSDLVVEESVVVELKAITAFAPVHHAQLITYLKLTGCPVGLLINFNVTSVRTWPEARGAAGLIQENPRSSRSSCLRVAPDGASG